MTWPMFVCFCAFVYLDTGRKGEEGGAAAGAA